MSLLRELTTESLDAGYAAAARRRTEAARRGDPVRDPRRTPLLAAGLVLLALLLTTAAAQVRERATAADTTRAALVQEVQQRTGDNDELTRSVAALRDETAQLRDDALSLTGEGAALGRRLGELEAVAGAEPLEGAGIVVTVDDAPAPEEALGGGEAEAVDGGRVLDTDVQRLVNGLWAAGAQGVAVNGRRLTSLTAIRAAGEAILVAYRPLSPPYVIKAVGEPGPLEAAFRSGSGGSFLDALGEKFGIRSSIGEDDALTLPAAAEITLRHATVPD